MSTRTNKRISQMKNEKILSKQNSHKKCRTNCAKHKFQFKPKQDGQYHPSVNISYCPIFHDRTEEYQSIIPTINADGKKYYPLFCIDFDRDHYQSNEEKYKEEHEKKVHDYVQQKEDLYEPKPGRKTKWCAVCKCSYDDYLAHVRDSTHSMNSQSNNFIKEISKIANRFQRNNLSENRYLQSVKQASDESNTKETVSTTIEQNEHETSEDVVEIHKDKMMFGNQMQDQRKSIASYTKHNNQSFYQYQLENNKSMQYSNTFRNEENTFNLVPQTSQQQPMIPPYDIPKMNPNLALLNNQNNNTSGTYRNLVLGYNNNKNDSQAFQFSELNNSHQQQSIHQQQQQQQSQQYRTNNKKRQFSEIDQKYAFNQSFDDLQNNKKIKFNDFDNNLGYISQFQLKQQNIQQPSQQNITQQSNINTQFNQCLQPTLQTMPYQQLKQQFTERWHPMQSSMKTFNQIMNYNNQMYQQQQQQQQQPILADIAYQQQQISLYTKQ